MRKIFYYFAGILFLTFGLSACNVDGSNLKQVTHLGKANWAPFFTPDGKHIERITYDNTFDAFPMFSFDGKKLIFSSSRNNRNQHGINLFIADWKP